jgi:hypothetical protein
MTGNDLDKKLLAVIAQAVEAMPNASAAKLCQWTRQHHGALIAEFQERWIDERLTSIYQAELRRHRPMRRGRPGLGHPLQDRFPFPGYENIPIWISLEVGTRNKRAKGIYLSEATLENLRTRRALVRGPLAAELPQLNKLISLMERYDKAQPGITVAEALKLHGARRRGSKLG